MASAQGGGFQEIHEAALIRHGRDALEKRLLVPKSASELKSWPEDRFLSTMSLRTFRAGLKHELVDKKWPAFEEVFQGFAVDPCAAMPDEAIEALLADRRLIRNLPKLRAVRHNALAIRDLRAIGGVGAWIGDWPGEQITGLWAELAKRFSQLGGNSGPYVLRMCGKDTFILSDYVSRALVHWGSLPAPPKNRTEIAAAQQVFNGWHAETGLPYCQLSQIAALSID